ncbi:hypothetical protein [Frankia sp. CcWB2]
MMLSITYLLLHYVPSASYLGLPRSSTFPGDGAHVFDAWSNLATLL